MEKAPDSRFQLPEKADENEVSHSVKIDDSLPVKTDECLPGERTDSLPSESVNSLPNESVNSLPNESVNSLPHESDNFPFEIEKSSDAAPSANDDSHPVELSDSDLVEFEFKFQKITKPGVIYLSYVPRYMTVKLVREYFNEFGEVRRLFLKPDQSGKPGKPSKFFSEGWVEFASRKDAKQVAECLNGAQVGGKRHTPFYDALWSIKYLKKFQWSQLKEKDAYKKAQKGQRMRAEIAQAKREVDFYTRGAEKQKRLKRSKDNDEGETSSSPLNVSDKKDPDSKQSEEESTNDKAVSVMKNILI